MVTKGDPPDHDVTPSAAEELRRKAEQRLSKSPDTFIRAVPEDPAATIHELQVHQIELEMQNEELRRAQLELDEQRSKYYVLFDLAPVGYLALGASGVISDANLTAARLLGVARDALVGKPFSAFVSAADRDVWYAKQQLLSQVDEPQSYDLRLLRSSAAASSGSFWASIETTPRHLLDGATDSYRVAFADIDKRVSLESAAQESDASLQAVLQSTADGILAVDTSNKVIFANERFAELWKIPAAAMAQGDDSVLLDRILDQLVDPRGFLYKVQELYGSDQESLDILRFKDGRVFKRTSRPLLRGAELRGRVWSFSDVTERVMESSELSRELELLSCVETVACVGGWRRSLNGDRDEWSEAALRILGLTREVCDGSPIQAIDSVMVPDDRESFWQWMNRESWTETDASVDFRIAMPDGKIRWICAEKALQTGEDGAPVATVGFVQDVTNRKRAEEERAGGTALTANVDGLTGLHNRRGFDLIAKQAISQAQRANQGVGLILCDIDGLASVNDELGRIEGDRVLEDAASVMQLVLRSADAIARTGGDEFVVLTVGSCGEDIVDMNTRLQSGFAAFDEDGKRSYRLSVSTGTAWSEPGAPCRLEELRAVADSAVYAEKLRRRSTGSPDFSLTQV